ncbi:MAG: ribonuclease Y [Patescibacteria group bacterium]
MDSLILWLLLGALAGGAGGFFLAAGKFKKQAEDASKKGQKLIAEAEAHAREIEKRAHEASSKSLATLEEARREAEKAHAKAEKIVAEAKSEEKEIKTKLTAIEQKLEEKEKNLDHKIDNLEKQKADLEVRNKEIADLKTEAEQLRDQEKSKLETIAKLSKEEAKAQLLTKIEKDNEEELVKKIQEGEAKAKLEADKKANKIIAQAIQRLAQEATSESTVTLVPLADDSLKGRIIGREGRNITAFEMATGVDVIVDDTPGAVLISGFDLLRRFVAKTALEKLISDGRIHPARIEETVKKAEEDAQKLMQEWGEQIVVETGVVGLPPNLMKLIGRLRFRTSYGQNVLKHSAEAAWLGAAIASELGADVKLVKTACLLHDIGKAVDHEIEGPHAVIGANILRKFKLSEEIVHAVEAHHEDVPIESMTDIIVQVADAISASRPGARRESLDAYIKRLEELENISKSFAGVANAFAIQAGREVRVIVKPEEIDDLAAHKLAKEISSKIESEMTYPGQIKVNVIRETRAEELAK